MPQTRMRIGWVQNETKVYLDPNSILIAWFRMWIQFRFETGWMIRIPKNNYIKVFEIGSRSQKHLLDESLLFC